MKRKQQRLLKKHTRGPNNDNIVWAHLLVVAGVGGRELAAAALTVAVVVSKGDALALLMMQLCALSYTATVMVHDANRNPTIQATVV